uniref:Coiled-coil domain containing 170 n=2 Tax=Nothobranchius kuhntae TaxID=321403 RepID=A0A1A8JGZ6_NOTKU
MLVNEETFFVLAFKTLSDMESGLHSASEELEKQTKLQCSTLQRAPLAAQQVQDLRERLQTLETKLQTADKHCDLLQHSKQHYEEFLEQLSETMKVNSPAEGLGFEIRLKLVLSRAEQLFRQEAGALREQTTDIQPTAKGHFCSMKK